VGRILGAQPNGSAANAVATGTAHLMEIWKGIQTSAFDTAVRLFASHP